MTGPRSALSRIAADARLREFTFIAYAGTWLLWIPAGLQERDVLSTPLPTTLLLIVGSFGPMIAAVAVAARHGGRSEVKDLFSRLRFRGVARRWFVLALLLGAVTVVPGLIYAATGGELDAGAVASHLTVLPLHFLLVATVGGGLDEEFGWRGMAQPLLQRHLRPVPANLLLGFVWALWHLPLWIDPSSPQAAYPLAVYTAVILGHSLVTGYLHNASGGSILIAIVVHSSNNTFDGLNYAILGAERGVLTWQLVLAAVSLGLGTAISLRTKGRLGLGPDIGGGAEERGDVAFASEPPTPPPPAPVGTDQSSRIGMVRQITRTTS